MTSTKVQHEYLFKLDNTTLPKRIGNRLFMWYFNRVLNHNTYRLWRRGRHSNRQLLFAEKNYQPNTQDDVPVKWAETICVYLVDKRPRSSYK